MALCDFNDLDRTYHLHWRARKNVRRSALAVRHRTVHNHMRVPVEAVARTLREFLLASRTSLSRFF